MYAGVGLTPQQFKLDGVEYTVKVLSDYDGRNFTLTLDQALPANFTLQVGGITLGSEDATLNEASAHASYRWDNQGAILADVKTVEVSLTSSE